MSSSHQVGTSAYTLVNDLIGSKEQPWGKTNLRRVLQRATYHAYSIWLFTASDIKTIIAPSLLFAVFTSPAASVFGISPALHAEDVLRRIPITVFWVWINLLPFAIDNQRHPDSIAEDALNKSWRTMPSKRMSPTQARTIMLCLYPLALLASLRLGGTQQCISLMALGFWYNNLRGADDNFIIRNLINAAGFNRFTTGAFDVMMGGTGNYPVTSALLIWQAVIAGIVFTTVQSQDMADQRGDAERDRRTVPLVIGDTFARWTIAIPMVFWCIFNPTFIGSSLLGYAYSVGLGGTIAARCLLLKSEASDKTTFKLWNLWLVSTYLLPLLKVLQSS